MTDLMSAGALNDWYERFHEECRRADALAAELAELRAAVTALTDYLRTHWSKREDSTDIVNRLFELADQPQGERGKALLNERHRLRMFVEMVSSWGCGRRNCDDVRCLNAAEAKEVLAAIDGARSDG